MSESTESIQPKNDWLLRQEILKDWLGRRLPIKGIFDKASFRDKHGWTALSQETEILIPSKGWCFLGHMWIQNAETMKDLQIGDRYAANCQINKYPKRDGEKVSILYNLKFPEDVQIREIPQVQRVASGLASAPQSTIGTPTMLARGFDNGGVGGKAPLQLLQVLSQGKKLTEAIGRERLKEVRDFLQGLGGGDKLEEFLDLISKE